MILSCAVAAVYDSTLNFRNNKMPTLLGILNGKKYHADIYLRYNEMFWHPGLQHFMSCLLVWSFFIWEIWLPPLTYRRIPLELIPEDEAECAAWLHKLYQEKVRVCWRWRFLMDTGFLHRGLFSRGSKPHRSWWMLYVSFTVSNSTNYDSDINDNSNRT